MNLVNNYKYWIGLIIVAALCLIVVQNLAAIFGFTYYIYHALLPLIFGVIIAFILNIIVNRYERHIFPRTKRTWLQHSRRPLAIILALLSIVLIVGFVLYMAIPQTIHALSLVVSNLPSMYDHVMKWGEETVKRIPYIDAQTYNQVAAKADFDHILDSISKYGLAWATNVMNTAGYIVGLFFNLLIGFLFSLYILGNKEALRSEFNGFFVAYFKEKNRNKIKHVIGVIYDTFSSFFIGQVLDSIALGILMFIGLLILQVPYAGSIACVVGLTSLIPLIGAYIGALVGILMVVMDDPLKAGLFIIVMVIMKEIDNNFIYPKLVGKTVGLPSIWVFASIIIGADLYGVIGILLGVPIAASIYKLVNEDIDRRLGEKVASAEIFGNDRLIVASGLLSKYGWIALLKKTVEVAGDSAKVVKDTVSDIAKAAKK